MTRKQRNQILSSARYAQATGETDAVTIAVDTGMFWFTGGKLTNRECNAALRLIAMSAHDKREA